MSNKYAAVAFCFDNTKRYEQGTGNTTEAQALAKKMASSWAAFAANGKPSIPGIAWEPSDPQTNKTMTWDSECRMVNDPEGAARKITSPARFQAGIRVKDWLDQGSPEAVLSEVRSQETRVPI